jgi:hypothetical protein
LMAGVASTLRPCTTMRAVGTCEMKGQGAGGSGGVRARRRGGCCKPQRAGHGLHAEGLPSARRQAGACCRKADLLRRRWPGLVRTGGGSVQGGLAGPRVPALPLPLAVSPSPPCKPSNHRAGLIAAAITVLRPHSPSPRPQPSPPRPLAAPSSALPCGAAAVCTPGVRYSETWRPVGQPHPSAASLRSQRAYSRC